MFKKIIQNYKYYLIALIMVSMPLVAFADQDPITKTGAKVTAILFGALGGSICAIFLGGTFVMAKTGKCSWDRFLFVAFCIAGFLGAPLLVKLIKSWVGH